MTTIAKKLAAGTTSVQDHFNALYQFFLNDAASWYIIDSEISGTDVDEVLLEQGAQQATLWMDAGDLWIVLDPDGAKSSLADSASPSSSASILALDSSKSYSTLSNVAEYDDAFSWIVLTPENDHHEWGMQAGVVYYSLMGDGPARGQTGHGILSGIPEFSGSSGVDSWASLTGIRHSRLRVGPEAWDGIETETYNASGDMDGEVFLTPYIAKTYGSGDTDSDIPFAVMRYCRIAPSTEDPRTVLPSSDSDEGWLWIGDSPTTNRLLILWDRTVTP